MSFDALALGDTLAERLYLGTDEIWSLVVDPILTTLVYTGAVQDFVVPTGITTVTIEAYGAQGGGAVAANGGKGARVIGSVAVTPGETLKVYVGGQGAGGHTRAATGNLGQGGGWNGGGNAFSDWHQGWGGGGASDIRRGGAALANRVIVAAGGGGASGGVGNIGQGGIGGAPNGATGGNDGGRGATTSAGGAAGPLGGGGGAAGNTAGSLGSGGRGINIGERPMAGGGGGGLYGGGGGGNQGGDQHNAGAGGGGGSSLIPVGGSAVAGDRSGNGLVVISYIPA